MCFSIRSLNVEKKGKGRPEDRGMPIPSGNDTSPVNGQRGSRDVDPLTMVVGNDSDVTAIRPYRTGDGMRDLHWASTARLNELVRKERQGAAESHTQLILDVHRRVASQLARRSDGSLDWAIRLTVGHCEAYFRMRVPVTLLFGMQRFEIRSSREKQLAMGD